VVREAIQPGQNSHTGEVFRRGPDHIPRGEIASLYRVLMVDDGPVAWELLSYSKKAVARLPFRLRLGRSLVLAARDPRHAPAILEQIADRLEGKPVPMLRPEIRHTTVFYNAAGPKLLEIVVLP